MKTKLILIVISLLLLFCLVFTYNKTDYAIDVYSEYVLKNTFHKRVNDCIYTYISENEALFKDVCLYKYTDNGAISAIFINSYSLNTIRSGLEKEITAEAEKFKQECFFMPIGNISGIKLFAEYGPKLKIKIVPLGTTKCDTVNTFKSVGVNHTLHSIGLDYTLLFSAAPPFGGTTHKAVFSITLCENLIAGEVPDVYFN